jgi:hypothetical protein
MWERQIFTKNIPNDLVTQEKTTATILPQPWND